MSYEIERKYLVRKLPENYEDYPSDEIIQGYYTREESKPHVRLRKKGSKYYKTFKEGSGVKRLEEEVEITREDFENVWYLTRGKRIYKTRYLIPYDGYTIELDLFDEKLKGLALAEVEFESVEESEEFNPPGWFGEEVTDDDNYRNSALAENGLPQ